MGIRCADHVTPLYPQKLALTLPTGGGRSVGIVRSRTKATEFSFSLVSLMALRKLPPFCRVIFILEYTTAGLPLLLVDSVACVPGM